MKKKEKKIYKKKKNGEFIKMDQNQGTLEQLEDYA